MDKRDPRKLAENCVRQAHQATSDSDRLLFLNMAQAWLEVARQQETIRALTMRAGREGEGTIQ